MRWTVVARREHGGDEIAHLSPARGSQPDTLRAVIESFVLREGTDGLHETSLEAKAAQVLMQLRRGEAHVTFQPASKSVNVVATSAIGRPGMQE